VVKRSNDGSVHAHAECPLRLTLFGLGGVNGGCVPIKYSWYHHPFLPESSAMPRTPRPKPLSTEPDLGLVDALALLTFAVQGTLGRLAAEEGLSIVQTRLLGILRDRQPTIKELAEFLQLDKSSVTGLVDRAQERGLVLRKPSALDGRSVHVSITATGRALVGQAVAAFEDEMAVLVSDLTPTERARLSILASKVTIAEAKRRGVDILSVDAAGRDASDR
jgi:DNA-binding MarR family transcriptional regulator